MHWLGKNQEQIFKILSVLYIAFILWMTIFSRSTGEQRIFKPLFWEIHVHYWRDIVKNILFFVPLGFLIGGKKGLLVGLCLTVLIETAQYVFVLGYCEPDDVLNNFIGTAFGVAMNSGFKFYVRNRKCRRK